VGVGCLESVYNQSAFVLQRIAPQHARCRSIGADRSRNRRRHLVAFGFNMGARRIKSLRRAESLWVVTIG
jgi:hypothetical protein